MARKRTPHCRFAAPARPPKIPLIDCSLPVIVFGGSLICLFGSRSYTREKGEGALCLAFPLSLPLHPPRLSFFALSLLHSFLYVPYIPFLPSVMLFVILVVLPARFGRAPPRLELRWKVCTSPEMRRYRAFNEMAAARETIPAPSSAFIYLSMCASNFGEERLSRLRQIWRHGVVGRSSFLERERSVHIRE